MKVIHSGVPSWKAWLSQVAPRHSISIWPELTRQDSPEAVTYRFNLPGYRRRDVHVELRDRSLIVRGERSRGWLRPKSHSSFVQSLSLPEDLDDQDVKASFRRGVLTITVGKQPYARARKVPIRVPARKVA